MDYVAEQLNVYDEIKNVGSAATLICSTLGTYTATTDSFTTTETSYATYALLTDCYRNDFGEQVMQGEKKMLIPAYGLPRIDQFGTKTNFIVMIKSRIFSPKNIKVLEPDTTALLYKIKVTG